MKIGLQEIPNDCRIFNRTMPDGTKRPISQFFERDTTSSEWGFCSKCGAKMSVKEIEEQMPLDPLCIDCMAQKGGGNDPSTEEEVK